MAGSKIAKEDRWQTLEYYIKRNPDKSIEECKKLQEEKLASRRKLTPFRLEYWMNQYPNETKEQCQQRLVHFQHSNNYQFVEFWQKKYPEKSYKECEALRNEYRNKIIANRPDSTGENNPGHRSRTTLQQRREHSASCIEFWQKKYPEKSYKECEKLLKEHKEWLKTLHTPENTCTCKEFWIKKGYTEEEAIQLLKERQNTFSLQKCMEKYGEDEGKKRFEARQQKWVKSLYKNFEKYGDGRSSQSKFASTLIDQICNILGIDRPSKEKWLTDPDTKKHYAYDFTYGYKMIEFNGDYWHENPDIYDRNHFNKRKQLYAYQIWEQDKIKLDCAHKNGYEVLVIWENGWTSDKTKELQKCIDFLKG